MTALVGKLRTRAHVLADLSVNHVERQTLLCGFSVERVQHDYGYDLTMTTFRDSGEIEPGSVYVQVKATDQLPLSKDGKRIVWLVSRRDLKLWLAEVDPVILIVYDGAKDRAFWVHIQAYFVNQRTTELFTAGEMIRVHLFTRNRLNRRAIQAIARFKNELRSQRKAHQHG